jgi:hypothetical protein
MAKPGTGTNILLTLILKYTPPPHPLLSLFLKNLRMLMAMPLFILDPNHVRSHKILGI